MPFQAMDEFCGSTFWETNITWNTDSPDLTRCFQDTVLVWIPCAFLWLLGPLEALRTARSRKSSIPWMFLNITRLVLATLLMLLSAADVGFEARQINEDQPPRPSAYTAPTLRLITFALAGCLMVRYRTHGRRSSGALWFFWMISALCGVPQLRTELTALTHSDSSTPVFRSGSFTACWFIIFLEFLLASFADRASTAGIKKGEKPCPATFSSFPSRLTFSWFDPMIWKGFRRPLEQIDLWLLRPQDSTKNVFPPFFANLESTKRKARSSETKSTKKEEISILPALIRTFGPLFLVSSFMRLIQVFVKYSSPLLLSLLIQFVETGDHMWHGALYAVLMLLVATTETLLLGTYNYITHLVGMRVRSALIATVYRKALRLSSAARKDSTVGEIVNIMSVDAQRFMDVCYFLNVGWAAPLEIILALGLLWQHLGIAVLAGLGAVFLVLPVSGLVMGRMERLEKRQMKQKDQRMKLMSEILSGIRVLKLYAWEESFQALVQRVRDKEQAIIRTRAVLDACVLLLWTCSPVCVVVVMFMTYLLMDSSHVLDAEKAFVSLALVNMMRLPLLLLPHLFVTLVQVRVATKRINKYMNAEELDFSCVHHDPNNPLALSIDNGTFTWAAGEPETLRGVNLAVNPGQLTAVVGPVGAGKSSLIAAMLGEMHLIEGRVHTKGSIAYVAQQAWIQNASLKDNILFGCPFNEEKYQNIIKACALEPDFEMLPAGDKTEIGEKGINLSGGQKQRLSLARAVYSNADVFLLDDPLSAVDSHVGKHIFEHVVGPGGLLKGKTRLLVTHSMAYLSEVDQVVVMKEGQVSESGSYNELLERKGAFAEFLAQHSQDGVATQEEVEDPKTNMSNGVAKNPKELARVTSHTSSQLEGDTCDSGGDAVLVGERLTEDERVEVGRVSWRVYWLYARCMGAFMVAGTISANVVHQALALGSGAWLSRWSTASDPDPVLYIGVYAALGFAYCVGSFFSGLAPMLGGWRAACVLHRRLVNRVLRAPLCFFDITPIGRILARFGKDMDKVDTYLPFEANSTIGSAFEVLSILVIISYSTPIFLVAVVPIFFTYLTVQQVYLSTTRQLYRLESTTRSPVYSHFGETITGAATIRAYGLQDAFEKESDRRVDLNQRCFFPGMISDRWMEVRVDAVGNTVIFLAAIFAVLARDSLGPGIVGLSVSYAMQLTGTLNWLVQIMSGMEKSIVAVERLDEYSNIKQEAPWELPCKVDLAQWPMQGEVDFQKLEIRYREGLDLVLHGISFKVKPGEKVGIVGRTGAGKSSLTLALFRLVEAAGGRIVIDGVDVATVGLHALRSRLTIIPQDPVLFSGSLRLNLDPFGRHDDPELWRALQMAHLHAFVSSLPAGLNHEVSEGGENLSVGQRQLICLARALLRNTKILVLDEATAGVDLETDDLIQKTIRTEFAGSTVLTIAHRLNTIMDCDRVLVLSQGRIEEFDSPTILLRRTDSAFYSMAKDAGLA